MAGPWTVRLLACLATGAVLLTGCSSKTEASESLPSSTSAAPTTEALPPLGPKDFPVPVEARQKTPAGSVAFVSYYVALAKFVAERSIDPKPLLDLSSGCRTCTQIVSSFQKDLAAGYKYRDYLYEFSAYGPGLLHDDTAEMGFVYVQGPITVVDAHGGVVAKRSTGKTGKLQSGATLKWNGEVQSWFITSLTVG